MNESLIIAESLRDQLRARIVGTSGYNFRLDYDQIELTFKLATEVKRFPFVCISAVSETVEQITVQEHFEKIIEIEIFGYIHDEQDSFSAIQKLKSDIETAILADSSLGGYVFGLSLRSDTGTIDDLSVCVVTIYAKYHYSPG